MHEKVMTRVEIHLNVVYVWKINDVKYASLSESSY